MVKKNTFLRFLKAHGRLLFPDAFWMLAVHCCNIATQLPRKKGSSSAYSWHQSGLPSWATTPQGQQ